MDQNYDLKGEPKKSGQKPEFMVQQNRYGVSIQTGGGDFK